MRILRTLKVIAFAAVAIFSVHAATRRLMKAVVLRKYGGPEALKLEEVSRPEAKDDEVLARVIAAGVNPAACDRSWGESGGCVRASGDAVEERPRQTADDHRL
jgi:hypothetical protein